MRKEKRSKEYVAWINMRDRCNNPNHKQYKNYGGRGIKVCDRWNSFETFIQDVGFAPTVNHSLDRYPDKDGDYTPENVRWATNEEQSKNKRVTVIVVIDGIEKCASDWCKHFGIDYSTYLDRVKKGWSKEDALKTPPQNQNNKKKSNG